MYILYMYVHMYLPKRTYNIHMIHICTILSFTVSGNISYLTHIVCATDYLDCATRLVLERCLEADAQYTT